MAKPKKSNKPKVAVTRTGPKSPNYRHLMPMPTLSGPRPPQGYSERRACAFCGKEGLGHQHTKPTAKLFCDGVCLKLYKHHLGVSRSVSSTSRSAA